MKGLTMKSGVLGGGVTEVPSLFFIKIQKV